MVPLLQSTESLSKLLHDSLANAVVDDTAASELFPQMAERLLEQRQALGCKSALRLVERAMAVAVQIDGNPGTEQYLQCLDQILDDLQGDELTAGQLCDVVYH